MKNYLKALSMVLCIIFAVFIMQIPRLLDMKDSLLITIMSGLAIPLAAIVNQLIFNKINKKYKTNT